MISSTISSIILRSTFVLALAQLSCVAAKQTADSRFGVMTHFAQGWPLSVVDKIGAGPVRFVRDEIPWADIEVKKGRFAFPRECDAYMAALAENDISPLVIFAFGNENYDKGMTPHSEQAIKGYSRYCSEVLAHYGSQIREVEIWNEYNGGFCQGAAKTNRVETYLRMLKSAYVRIKRDRPEVTVCAGATEGIPLPYWEKLLAGGAARYMDVATVHPYRFEQPPEGLERDIEELRELIKKYNGGADKPIWVSEIGWGSGLEHGALSVDEVTQAKFLVRAYVLLLSAKVERVYWYLFKDHQQFKMGLIKDEGGSQAHRRAFTALKTLMEQLRGASFSARESTDEDVYSFLFSTPEGEQIRVMWSIDEASHEVQCSGQAVDITGRKLDTTKAIMLSDAPIYVKGPIKGPAMQCKKSKGRTADARRNFSNEQGKDGWNYGYYRGNEFASMTDCVTIESKMQWEGGAPYSLISATEQHPSVEDGKRLPVVRRWVCPVECEIEIRAVFHCGSEGDGVGVSVWVAGKQLFREVIGGRAKLSKSFTATLVVKKGTTVDFVVDPGPGTNIDFDGTTVRANIHYDQ